MRGQASVEHLAILGVALLIVIPATILFSNYARTENERVIKTQISRIGEEITRAAETIAIVGAGSHTVLKFNLPDAVDEMYLAGDMLVIKYHTFNGPGQDMYFADVTMFGPYDYTPSEPADDLTTLTDHFHDGLMKIKVAAVNRFNAVQANISEAP